MKKKRLLAALLCAMMVMTCLPVMTWAAPTAAEMDAAGEFLGAASITPTKTALGNNGVFDFADSGANLSITASTMDKAEYTADGLKLSEGSWRYSAVAKWTLFNFGSYVYLKVKAAETGTLVGNIYLCASTHAKGVFTLSKDAMTFHDKDGTMTNLVEFTPGDGWIEILFQRDTSVSQDYSNGAQNWFVKGGNLTSWTKIATTGLDKWIDGSSSDGLNFSGSGTVNYCAVVEPSDTKQDTSGGSEDDGNSFATIKDILGYDVKAVDGQDFQFTNNFSSSTDNVTTPAGGTYDNTNGLDLTGVTAEITGGSWKYSPSERWTPFSGDPRRVVVFEAKVKESGSVINQIYYPTGTHNRVYLNISDTEVTVNKANWGVAAKEFAFVPGTDWAKYLIKINEDNGFSVYVNSETKTSGKWKLLATVANADWLAGSNNTAIQFTGNYSGITGTKTAGGYVKSLTIYEKDTSAGGGNTPSIPSGENYDGTQGKIADVLGSDAVIIKDLQFSTDFDKQQAGVSVQADTLFDDGKGMMLGEGKQFQYLPASGYTPLTYKGMTAGVKVAAGDAIVIQVKHPTNNSFRTYVQISPDSVWVSQSNGEGGFAGCPNLVDYVPGNGWNDYLITANENQGYDVYAKPQADEEWTKVCSTTSYRPGGSAGMGIQFFSSKGSSWVKYASVYGTQEQLPEPEGPEAGTKMTLEDIIGGIAVAEEELIFDSNFNGIEANAQLKNPQTGEVAETQPSVGANGLELVQTAGKYFAWNSGTENSWKPLTKDNPVMFRAKLEAGSMLDVQLNGNPRASLYLYPDKLIVQGTAQTQAKDFAPGTGWLNYLVTRDSSNFMVWTKEDGETEWTLRVTSTGFRTAGFYGVLFANTTTNKVTLSAVKQYKIERMVLTDANTIATMNNRVYIDEDFSEDTGVHNIITGKIENGVFQRDPDAEPHASYPDASRLDVDLSQVNPKGEWFIRFKYMIPTADSVMSLDMVNNGNKLAIDCHEDYIFIINRTSGVNKSSTEAAAGLGNWAELLFVWTDNAYCDVYWHKVGDDEWIKTHTKFVPGSEANDKLAFHCKLQAQVDDVKVYSGDYLKIDEPVLESGLVKTGGEYFTGTLESRYDRRATLITAVYDSTYGYTKFVKAKDYEVLSGRGANLTNTFVTTGVDETKDGAAVMLWDSLETGIPLGDMTGAALQNNATGAAGNAAVSVTAEANYNDIRITGYTGIKNGRVTISVVDENGVIRAAGQTTSTGTGLVDASVAVDPACPSGTYTVRVQYGTTGATATEVELFCDDIPYNSVTDVTSMKNFIYNYGSETAQKWNQEEDFASDVYNRFVDAKGGTTTFTSLYHFRDAMDVATNGEVHEREFCQNVNNAAVGGKWSEVQNLVLDGTLGLTIADISGISDKKALFMRMTGGYKSEGDVLAGFQSALAAQKAAEAGGGGFGGGTGGGTGGSVGSGLFQGTTGFENTGSSGGGFGGMAPVELPADFNDLESVAWAKDAIVALRNMGVISGDGDGTFAPNRAVTREEFLKMIMQAAGIQGNSSIAVPFADVDANEWYYPYVAAAYQNGIVQGISEDLFGIGQQITRADMAVMLKRVMDYKNIELEKKTAAYVFDDFDTIPEYARESIDALAQANLMNGKGENKFDGEAFATRAEAAVAIYRIYNYMVEGR